MLFRSLDLVEAVEAEIGERSVGLAIEDDDLVELVAVGDVVEIVSARIGAAVESDRGGDD